MKPENEWLRTWFTREMPLGEEETSLTASFEVYDNGVVGIHLHRCFINGLPCQEALDIISHFKSRTEYDEEHTGVYILVRGEMPCVDGYRGLPVKAYWLTLETIVYTEIEDGQDGLDWMFDEYAQFLTDAQSDYYSERYYRQISYEDGKLKITLPNVKQGSRHKTLLSYGGRLLSEGVPDELIEVRMYDFNHLYCVPPLPFDDLQSIVKSVMKYKGV